MYHAKPLNKGDCDDGSPKQGNDVTGIRTSFSMIFAMAVTLWPFAASADFRKSDLKADPSGQFYCDETMDWCFGLAQKPSNAGEGHTPLLLVLRAGKEVTRQEIILGKRRHDGNGGWRKTGIWPHRFHDPQRRGAFLMGIVTTTTVGYSGGGASVAMLSLIRVDPTPGNNPTGTPPVLGMVATVPLEASKMIRACFSEQDAIDRHQVCHDEYDFEASITPVSEVGAQVGGDDTGQGNMPSLQYVARASRFPPNADLGTDSSVRPPLNKQEMVRAPDLACSFDAVFRFDRKAQVYEIDLPIEGCETYLVP